MNAAKFKRRTIAAICFRWYWRWRPFLWVWGREAVGALIVVVESLLFLLRGLGLIALACLFPLRWLVIAPLRGSLTHSAEQAEALAKILESHRGGKKKAPGDRG